MSKLESADFKPIAKKIKYFLEKDKTILVFGLQCEGFTIKDNPQILFISPYSEEDTKIHIDRKLFNVISKENWNELTKEYFNDDIKFIGGAEAYNTAYTFIVPSRINNANFKEHLHVTISFEWSTYSCFAGFRTNTFLVFSYDTIKPYLYPLPNIIDRINLKIAKEYTKRVNSIEKRYLESKEEYDKIYNSIERKCDDSQKLYIRINKEFQNPNKY